MDGGIRGKGGGWLLGWLHELGDRMEGIFFFLISCPKQKRNSRALSNESSLHTKETQAEKAGCFAPSREQVQAQPQTECLDPPGGSPPHSPPSPRLTVPGWGERPAPTSGGGVPRGRNKLPLSRGPWAPHTGALSGPPPRPTGEGGPT